MNEQPEFVNYNVKAYNSLDEFRRWRDEYKIQLRVFDNYDGSGWNYFICEFQTLEHAQAFMKHFNITGDRKLWAEDKDGHNHYLNGTN